MEGEEGGSSAQVVTSRGGRSRGGSRGRGRGARGRCRGAVGASDRSRLARNGAVKGWSVPKAPEQGIMMEEVFASQMFGDEARLYTHGAMQRLEHALRAHQFEGSRIGILQLFISETIDTLIKWTNEHIRLQSLQVDNLEHWEMYQFFGLLIFSHLTNLNFKTVLDKFVSRSTHLSKMDVIDLTRARFISSNLLAYSAMNRGNVVGNDTWDSQRDQTVRLTEFETVLLRRTRQVFLSSTMKASLDDESYGCRASDNQVKKLNPRKSDSEGYSADVVCDSLFRIPIAIRFNRRGERKLIMYQKLLSRCCKIWGR